MLKSHWLIISRLARLGDNLLIGLSFLVTYHFRDWFVAVFARLTDSSLYGGGLASIETYLVVLGIALPLYNAFLSMQGAYRSMRFQTRFGLFRIIAISSVLTFFSLGSLFFMLKLDLSRSFVGIFCLVSGLSLFAERLAILQALRFFRVRGKNFRNLLIVGTGEQAVQLFHEMKDSPEYGVKIVGFCELDVSSRSLAKKSAPASNVDYQHVDENALPGRLLANVATFERILKRFAVDEVLFTDVVKHYPTIDELSQIAIDEGVRVTLAADLFSMEIYRSDISYFGNIPLIHYEISPGGSDNPGLVIKRLIDIVFSATLLTVLSPVLLLTALAIKIDNPGPIFFKQRRVGLNGRRFTLLKFRSMVPGAARQKAKLEKLNEMKGPVFKIANDPRITKVGKFIRSYSIDELPQLFNVLKGDMSLVGPRPPLPSEVSHYRRKQRRRLSMRPGLTCIWQVSGRNDIPDFEEWAKLDLEYIDNWNLKRDFMLMLKTIPVVFSGSGS